MHYLEGEESSKNVYSKKIIKKACKMMMKNELPMKEISKRTGIPIDSLYDIRCGRSWRSVAKEYTFPEIPTRQKGSSYIEKDIRKVCKLLEKGKLSNKEISDRTGVKISTVNDVKHKRRWTYVSEDYSI